ncbi:MAG: succinyl-diaminopimelate desuccinylase [Alphaproteobacteria bacterium]|nr:succinyl-diaminopimelate desuccinylase [Alphaproteobacteria bacterium]
MVDPIALAQALIRCPSVTPNDEGALSVIETALKPLGFRLHRLTYGGVENLYARLGTSSPVFCFAGHADVVPPGHRNLWHSDPFEAEIRDGVLYGRGAADMKGAVAAFTAAVERILRKAPIEGSIALLITGDEEGEAINGTTKVLAWMKEHGERIDHCVVGEPSSAAAVGDTIKVGRRGSVTFRVTVQGTQGHVAYPARALNPIPALAVLVTRLNDLTLDDGTAYFDPSTLAFTSVDVGNPAANVIPAEARAALNIRFNDLHTSASLVRRIESEAAAVARETACTIVVEPSVSGEAFLTQPGPFLELLQKVVAGATGELPQLSTGGGTSDARFIKDQCPVAELGLVNATMHKADECAPVADILRLVDLYEAILKTYFANPPR